MSVRLQDEPFNKFLPGPVNRPCFNWYGQIDAYQYDISRSSESI